MNQQANGTSFTVTDNTDPEPGTSIDPESKQQHWMPRNTKTKYSIYKVYTTPSLRMKPVKEEDDIEYYLMTFVCIAFKD